MQSHVYRELLRIARRHARHAPEAEDLLQDALLEAVRSGRSDLAETANRRWLAGVIRNRAAMLARSAIRRKQRETLWLADREPPVGSAADPLTELLLGLSPGLKAVAALALSGHSRREIGYLLRVDDATLRQRIVALKRQLQARGVPMPGLTPGLSLDLSYGRIREALLPKLLREGGLFASHDPDGHLIVFATSQNPGRRQQTDISHKETDR